MVVAVVVLVAQEQTDKQVPQDRAMVA
jgi:hypothetical protein